MQYKYLFCFVDVFLLTPPFLFLAFPPLTDSHPVRYALFAETLDTLENIHTPKSTRGLNESLEFVSDGLYQPPGVGAVLSGFVLRGTAKVRPMQTRPRLVALR